jgi:cytochrome c oxidase subunit I
MVSAWVRGPRATHNPWNAIGLEWLLPSPPAEDNFGEHVPVVISRPYGYGLGQPLVEHQAEIEQALTAADQLEAAR